MWEVLPAARAERNNRVKSVRDGLIISAPGERKHSITNRCVCICNTQGGFLNESRAHRNFSRVLLLDCFGLILLLLLSVCFRMYEYSRSWCVLEW